jgi:hypothetical protein
MGCGSSDATSSTTPSTTATNSNTTDFVVIVQQVKQTWPNVKNIDKLGGKTFA